MDKFSAYKEIKDRSLFNIIPEKYHQEILEGCELIQLQKGEEDRLKSPKDALYIVVDGTISLYEKERKIKIAVKEVTKGRSLDLDRFLQKSDTSIYDWGITEDIKVFEISSALMFEIFERDQVFYTYLQRVLTSFELRKLKNDLRLFGFNEDEIQKTFFCLEDHTGSIKEIGDSICIISKSQATFYYYFDGYKKILGEFKFGDFFVWNKNRKLNYELDEDFSCWKLEVVNWESHVDKDKILNFIQLVDPFKGKIHNIKGISTPSNNEEITLVQEEEFESFCEEEFVDFEDEYMTSEDICDSGMIATLCLLQSFKMKISNDYLTTILPVGVDGSNLYDIKRVFDFLNFKTLLKKISRKELKEIRWPFIVKYLDRHVTVYEVENNEVLVMDPLLGKQRVTIDKFEKESSLLVLLVKKNNLDFKKTYKTHIIKDYVNIVLTAKIPLLFVFLSSILIFFLNLSIPIVLQIIFDEVLVSKNLELLQVVSLSAIFLLVMSSLLVYTRSYLLSFLTTKIDAQFSATFFDRLLQLNRKFYEKYSSGDIISRLNELKKIRKFLTAKTFKIVIDLFSALVFICFMGFYSIKLLVCVLVFLPLMYAFLKVFTPRIVRSLTKLYVYGAKAQGYLLEQFGSIDTIKSYNMGYRARQNWQIEFNKVLNERKKVELLNSLVGVGSDFFLQLIPLVVIICAISLYIDNSLTLGQVIASSTMVGFIVYPIINLMKFVDDFKQMTVSFNRINEVVTTAGEQSFGKGQELDDELQNISVERLSYKYGDELSPYILKEINFQIDVGQSIAIVGGSGAGKTTLSHLLIGSDNPTDGKIKYNGINLEHLNLTKIKGLVTYVGPDAQVFSGSIVDNISLSSPESSLEDVVQAAKLADAHEFISSLPEGYMTVLGEGGEGLSLGQKQKISIARAIYNKPKVLLLDEATSILDTASERNIYQNLKDSMLGKTFIIVTHRLDILGHIDNIFVMHKGEIVEHGKHDRLVLNQGRYYEMWKDLNY